MSKRKGFDPFILLTEPGDGTTTGGASAGGGVDPLVSGPISFDAWLSSAWREDMNQDDSVDVWDYFMWWLANGFSREQWESIGGNPEWPEPDEPGEEP